MPGNTGRTGPGGPGLPVPTAAQPPVPQAPHPPRQLPDDPEQVARELTSAAAALGDLKSTPVAEHVARYDEVHTALQDALASIDGV